MSLSPHKSVKTVVVRDGTRRVVDSRVRQKDVELDVGEPTQAIDHLRLAGLDREGLPAPADDEGRKRMENEKWRLENVK
jgi:hypothetical protein